MEEKITEKQGELIEKYVNWILQECDSPYSEIEWLVQNIPQDLREDIFETIKNH